MLVLKLINPLMEHKIIYKRFGGNWIHGGEGPRQILSQD